MLEGKDLINGAKGDVFLVIGSQRYKLAHCKDFESKLDKDKEEVALLGNMMKQHKSGLLNGTFSCTIRYVESVLRLAMQHYKETGEDLYCDIIVTNDDKGSTVGRQTVIHKNCNFDSQILAKLDVDATVLEESIDGTFDDYEMPETFSNYSGLLQN